MAAVPLPEESSEAGHLSKTGYDEGCMPFIRFQELRRKVMATDEAVSRPVFLGNGTGQAVSKPSLEGRSRAPARDPLRGAARRAPPMAPSLQAPLRSAFLRLDEASRRRRERIRSTSPGRPKASRLESVELCGQVRPQR